MKKKSFLVSCAVAGMLIGGQAAFAHEHEEDEAAATKEGKNACKGKEGKNSCKSKDKKKDEGANACSGPNGCDGKETKVEEEKKK